MSMVVTWKFRRRKGGIVEIGFFWLKLKRTNLLEENWYLRSDDHHFEIFSRVCSGGLWAVIGSEVCRDN